MNQPPSGDGDDDMERRFQTGLQDDGGPSEAVRRAILDHASRMAAEHAESRPGGRSPAMLTARRRNTIFGALAAAVFAGLLVVPILRTPVVHRQSPAAQRRITADADKLTAAAGPAASSSSEYASQANTEPQSVLGAAPSPAPADTRAAASDVASSIAAAPAAPSRQLARATTSSVERGESLRGAAAAGNLTAVNAVLGSSFDVDARDRSGRTALMLAILNGHADVVDALLAHGAGINAVDSSGVRPLQMARTKGNEEIIDSLLRAGAH
jgi:ankyrin repeat protein